MKKIPIILGIILGMCMTALVAIDLLFPSLTADEIKCMKMGLPASAISVQACANLLRIERDIDHLNSDLDRLKISINPGIDI